MGKIKIKAKMKGDKAAVKVMLKHPMLTYDQAKKKGKEPNFVTHMTAKLGDKVVYDLSSSQFFSKNPIFKFHVNGAKAGDEIEVSYTDLKGNSESAKKKIK
jgi:sulfur-oxidizing protein SoxZ